MVADPLPLSALVLPRSATEGGEQAKRGRFATSSDTPGRDPGDEFSKSIMPKKQTIERARRDEREGKSASTQAGEFVREEIEEIRAGKHGARSTKQAIAIGLSKARRAGVKLAPPKPGKTSEATRRKAQRDLEMANSGKKPSSKRSKATLKALQRESGEAASPEALSRQARTAARKRPAIARSASAKKAARTRKGLVG
jgi:Family of unknown function (DUF6496)